MLIDVVEEQIKGFIVFVCDKYREFGFAQAMFVAEKKWLLT